MIASCDTGGKKYLDNRVEHDKRTIKKVASNLLDVERKKWPQLLHSRVESPRLKCPQQIVEKVGSDFISAVFPPRENRRVNA